MKYYPVKAVAEMMIVDDGKVRGFIQRGELVAINVAHVADGRPRWRISEAALNDFLQRRQSRPPAPIVKRPRKSLPEVEKFV